MSPSFYQCLVSSTRVSLVWIIGLHYPNAWYLLTCNLSNLWDHEEITSDLFTNHWMYENIIDKPSIPYGPILILYDSSFYSINRFLETNHMHVFPSILVSSSMYHQSFIRLSGNYILIPLLHGLELSILGGNSILLSLHLIRYIH